MDEQRPTRIEQARLRASTAKQVLAIGSAAAFVAALLLARSSNPGRPGATPTSASSSSSAGESLDESDDGFDFGSGSISPSTGSLPQVQSGVS